jgi:ATP phosphoribosyltransferase regulatory subunit HisZ
MDDTRLEDKLNELLKEFGDASDLQASKLAKLAKQAQANRKQLENSINRLQDLLDYLRVCIKYQAFDLEATRRENQYLRKLLEGDNR